jgi:hypothetical protein
VTAEAKVVTRKGRSLRRLFDAFRPDAGTHKARINGLKEFARVPGSNIFNRLHA